MLESNNGSFDLLSTRNNYMKNIDINKFNKAMDQIVETYSEPKKVTEFERKVGASVCRAA